MSLKCFVVKLHLLIQRKMFSVWTIFIRNKLICWFKLACKYNLALRYILHLITLFFVVKYRNILLLFTWKERSFLFLGENYIWIHINESYNNSSIMLLYNKRLRLCMDFPCSWVCLCFKYAIHKLFICIHMLKFDYLQNISFFVNCFKSN